MAQHHLGDRRPYMVRARVEANLESAAFNAGYRSVSRWLADVAYDAVGRSDLKLGPDGGEEETNQLDLLSA